MAESLRVGIIGGGERLAAVLDGLKAVWDDGQVAFTLAALACGDEPAPLTRDGVSGAAAANDPLRPPRIVVGDLHDPAATLVTSAAEAIAASDAVIVLDGTEERDQVALAAVSAGRQVLLDPPLADTLAAAERLLAAAEPSQVAIAAVHRFEAVWRMAHWCLAQGAVGDVRLLVDLDLGSEAGSARRRAELLGRLAWLAGPVATISAAAPREEPDAFLATVQFVSGAVGVLGRWGGEGGGTARVPLTIQGTEGSLVQGRLLCGDAEESVVRHFELGAGETRQRLFPRPIYAAAGLMLHNWLLASTERRPAEVPAAAALADLRALRAVAESVAAAGEPVAIAD